MAVSHLTQLLLVFSLRIASTQSACCRRSTAATPSLSRSRPHFRQTRLLMGIASNPASSMLESLTSADYLESVGIRGEDDLLRVTGIQT